MYELIRGATCERDAPEFYLKGEQHRKNEDKICAITGLPAKYRDPKSGSNTRTIGRFKQLLTTGEERSEEKEKEKENAEADVPVKMEDEQQQKQKQKQEQPKRASIWDPPVPGR